MRIGITGHRSLPDPALWAWVESAIREELAASPRPVTGITNLAAGADQLFARCVLESGGSLEAIIPFSDYERTFADGAEKEAYLRLLASAAEVTVIPDSGDDELAFLHAGLRMMESCDLLIAVWDGQPARGIGGTAAIVDAALSQNITVTHVDTASRAVRRFPGNRS